MVWVLNNNYIPFSDSIVELSLMQILTTFS